MRQAAGWLAQVREQLGEDNLKITWRAFLLEQVNAKEEGWKAWEQGSDYESKGIPALRASEAARWQDDAAHNAFVDVLLTVKHQDREDIRERSVLLDAAGQAGLDLARFESDMEAPGTLEAVVRDHEWAAERGVFGTPTFVFEDGFPVFLKTFTPPAEEALPMWENFVAVARGASYLGEIKRPQPPWPRGVFGTSDGGSQSS